MDDRELLELAAKAADVEHGADRLDCGLSITLPNGQHRSLPRWNPLDDDADALQLAVKLRLYVRINTHDTFTYQARNFLASSAAETHESDPYAATRRAIVRAAAKIGSGFNMSIKRPCAEGEI